MVYGPWAMGRSWAMVNGLSAMGDGQVHGRWAWAMVDRLGHQRNRFGVCSEFLDILDSRFQILDSPLV
jgi:hypothetical protein